MKAVEAKGSFAALLVGLCVMGAFGDDLVVDTTAGDRTIAEDIALAEGEVLRKVGPNTLTLTGHNTFGGLVQLEGGTLRADFGQGLDANYGVSFTGGALSSLTGSIVATCGTGIRLRGPAAGCHQSAEDFQAVGLCFLYTRGGMESAGERACRV